MRTGEAFQLFAHPSLPTRRPRLSSTIRARSSWQKRGASRKRYGTSHKLGKWMPVEDLT